jgi:pyruvate dehydrogenase E2 component (dihydrolipoamide acetyltransferase)
MKTNRVEAIDEGTVGKIVVAEGTEGVKVNAVIAVLIQDGEDASAIDVTTAEPTPEPAKAQTDETVPPPPAASQSPASQTTTSAPPAPPKPVESTNVVLNGADGPRIFASPLARRLAKQNGLELSLLEGSGPRGRIVKADITRALETGAGKPAASVPTGTALATTASQTPGRAPGVSGMSDEQVLALYEQDSFDVVPHDGMRKVIAERLTASKQTIPHFYMTVECELDELLSARARLNGMAPKDGPRAYKLSVNDFVIKALALALQDVPGANASWTEQGMLLHRSSDIGVAVAVEGGLFTPIIRHAEEKSLSEISNEMKDLAGRARNRRLAPHEYQGGTSSISNLGMYGIKEFDAVINPPHATILAVGAGLQQPVVRDNGLAVATVMSCTLSCDHRVVDGALGAELLNAFKAYIEDPIKMLV